MSSPSKPPPPRLGLSPESPSALSSLPVAEASERIGQAIAEPTVSPSTKRRSSISQEILQTDLEMAGPVVPHQPSANTAKRARRNGGRPKRLPRRYEQCAGYDMVELIAHLLGELITTNDAISIAGGRLTRFHSRTAPGISVGEYLHRLEKHATLTPPLLLVIVYYIDRLCALYPDFTINTLTVHRFLITAATVAAKGLSDSFWNNSTYARVGGVRVAELKTLELEFLHRLDWKIVPTTDVMTNYYRFLVDRMPGYAFVSETGSEGEEEGEEADFDDSGDNEENSSENEGG